MVRGKRRSAEFCRKRERVQGPRDRGSTEGSENSVVMARDGVWFFFCVCFSFLCPRWSLFD